MNSSPPSPSPTPDPSSNQTLYHHWRLYRGEWRWPNFSAVELSCRHCGEYYHDEAALDALQRARNLVGKPLIINSAHRCVEHNRTVDGVKDSQHLRIAFDIQLAGHDRHRLMKACQKAGFGSFGFYRTFLHVDLRPGRSWYGAGAQEAWQ